MTNEASHNVFARAFRARMRAARKARGFSQADVARLLEISRASYAKYETRALLPHRLVVEFAEITGVGFAELFRHPG
jgi:transcriptional regulator with XRE-family HTH domain